MRIVTERGGEDKNGTVKVKNVHSGSGNGGWLKKWKEYKKTGSKTVYCSNLEHTTKCVAKHGGHVKKVDGISSRRYIVPLCVKCNENKDMEYLVESYVMVPVKEL